MSITSITEKTTRETEFALPVAEQSPPQKSAIEMIQSTQWTSIASQKRLEAIVSDRSFKEGVLNLSGYPGISNPDIISLLSVIKKGSFNVTSVNMTGCKNISNKTLKSLEGLPISILDVNHCPHITNVGLKSLKNLPLIALGLDGTTMTNVGLAVLKKAAPSLQVLHLRSAKNITDLTALEGLPITYLDCSGSGVRVFSWMIFPRLKECRLYSREISIKTVAENLTWISLPKSEKQTVEVDQA